MLRGVRFNRMGGRSHLCGFAGARIRPARPEHQTCMQILYATDCVRAATGVEGVAVRVGEASGAGCVLDGAAVGVADDGLCTSEEAIHTQDTYADGFLVKKLVMLCC